MGFSETLLFYHVIGLSVAVAVWSQGRERSFSEQSFRAVSAVVFWPVYLPMLLTPAKTDEVPPRGSTASYADELSARIDEVDGELEAALSGLDGWAEQILARERDRIAELRSAWSWQAGRIREMDDVLRGLHIKETYSTNPSNEPREDSPCLGAPAHQSERSRQQNLVRLRQVRNQTYEDLVATLARVRELISLIHLAKFTGAPASRADELLQQIAASVEGLSEVAGWRAVPVRLTCRSQSNSPRPGRVQPSTITPSEE